MPIYTAPRFNLPDYERLWKMPPFGGDQYPGGYATEGDVLVSVTNDGVDLNAVWTEMAAALAEWNAHRTALVDLISYWHTSAGEAVLQALNESSYELATEFGEPTALRFPSEYTLMGFDLDDFDRATRFTWKALRDMDSRQLRAFHDEALAADNKLVSGSILERLFSPVPDENWFGMTCFGLWNGADGMTPPKFLGHTFPQNHSHYLVSGSVDIDSGDIEFAVRDIRSHGYGLTDTNQKLLVLQP